MQPLNNMKMKMKRTFDEISEEEWENLPHSFDPSRVLKNPQTPHPPPPPIESFAFRSNPKKHQPSLPPSPQTDDDPDFAEISNYCSLEDDDADLGSSAPPPAINRGRRFVVDDDDDGDDGLVEVFDVKSTDDDDDDDEIEEVHFEEEEEEDVVSKALQRCAKISSELKKELFGSSLASCEHYSQVEASSNRIVTQDDIDAACSSEDSDFQPILKPYQLVGVNFLLLLHRKGVGGAILADEMGLGKTIQAITYLSLLKHLNKDSGPHLIVCPSSLLENWERELKRWCPSFSVLQYHGAARSACSKELSSLSKAGLPPPFNVLLVCYSLFERHSVQQKDDRKILKRWRWSCVLMDEAHALKDKNSYRWKNLMSVARNANQRLMLTGTPLQNDLHELWSLLEFMMPELFATEDVDLKKLLSADDRDLVGRMKSILGPFILRRLKSDVMQQLVPKIHKVEFVSMDQQQEDAYREAIEEYRAFSKSRLEKLSGDNLRSVGKILPKRQISNYFFQFRKIANHPLLVRRVYNDEDVVHFAKKLYPMGVFGFECTLERVIEELRSYNDYTIHRLLLCHGITDGVLSSDHAMLSAKCRELAELLPALEKGGHRVLIFSQWTSMLDILEWTLDIIGLSYKRLDGSTQVTDRQTIVDTFNNDTSIFACLLSTRAGGQGLNLTGADTVVIHDMDFNPQIDRQAEDRCHRIGQTKPVTIYRLVTKGTVDENVYEIAQRKLVLDAAVLESGVEVDNHGNASDKTMGEILSALFRG